MDLPLNDLKVSVVRRPDYEISLEQVRTHGLDLPDPVTFIHADVQRWGAGVERAFRADLVSLRSLLASPIFAFIREDNSLLQKFAARMGFSRLLPVSRADGEWEVWAHH